MSQLNLTYQIELPGHPAKAVKDASKASTDEALRKQLSGSEKLISFANPAQYWIRRETDGTVQTIKFEQIKSACVRFATATIDVIPQEALVDDEVLAKLRVAYPSQDFQQATIMRSCENSVLVAEVTVATMPTPMSNDAVNDDSLAGLFDEDVHEVSAGNLASVASLATPSANPAPAEKPIAPQSPTQVSGDETKAEDGDEDEDDEVDIVPTLAASEADVHLPATYAEAVKNITLVIVPNPLDATQPHLSYSVGVRGLYLKVGMTSLEAFGALPTPIQQLLDDAASQWDALLKTRSDRDAVAAAKKVADAVKSKRKADEARALTKAKAVKKVKAGGKATSTKPDATASEVPLPSEIRDADSGDPAEANTSDKPLNTTTQMGMFGN